MKNRIAKAIPMALALILMLPLVAGCPAEEPPEEPVRTTITILHIGDFHAHLDPFKPGRAEEYIGGIARIASLVNHIRAEQPNTILLDAGSTIHGANLANLFQGEPVIAAMNAMGFTAMGVGIHDFHYGRDVLLERAEQAEFPILGANVRCQDTGEPFLPPYIIIEVGRLRIGIIGLVATDTPIRTHPRNVEGLEFLAPVAVTRKLVEQLDPQVDLIVLLAHLDCEEEIPVIEEVPGIAVSVGAACSIESVKQLQNTILVDSGNRGEVLGRLDIVVKDGRVIDFSHEFIPITPAIEEHAGVNALLTPYRDALEVKLSEVVGETKVAIYRGQWWRHRKETNMGNLIADVMRQVSGADIAIQNSGALRADIDVGPITLEEIFSAFPFNDYVLVLELTGEVIWKALEHSVGDETGGWAFPQVSGISFVFDPALPCGDRIVDVTIGGEPLDLDRTYLVATSCFLATGGDGYWMFEEARVVLHMGQLLRDAVAAYVRERGIIAPEVEGRSLGK